MSHVVDLPGGWSLWRWFVLRGAGLPAAMLSRLAAPQTIVAVTAVLERQAEASVARTTAIAALERVIDQLKGDARKPVGRALKKLRGGAVPELAPELVEATVIASPTNVGRAAPPEAVRSTIEGLRDAERALADARVAAETAFAADAKQISSHLREIAGDPRFVEACLWQNRSAVRTAIDRVRNGSTSSPNQHHQHEQLVARYLQRYCAKNDTIGFFGPIGWGRFVTDAADAVAVPGPNLVSKRTVYFEHWGIDELAARLAKEIDLLPYTAPRRMPTIRLEGQILHHGLGRQTDLPPEVAAVLAACDGVRTARDIALSLPLDELDLDELDVYSVLAELRDKKLVTWTLEIPGSTAYPEAVLRELLERAEGEVRDRGLAALDELEQARDRVAAAAGDTDALRPALDEVDATFVRLTSREATRNPGATYAGRTLVYEDCRRDYELRLGPWFFAAIGAPLALLFQSARWYTYTVAERFRAELDRVYDELRAETGEAVLDYPRFRDRAVDVFPSEDDERDLVTGVLEELHRRWASVVAFQPGDRRVELSSASLSPAVAQAFAAPCPGWPVARFHSPDLMIVARSREAMLAGDATVVLGELHSGRNTLTVPLFLKECPFADELLRAQRIDVPRRGQPVLPKRLAMRPSFGPAVECDFELESGVTRSALPRERVLAAADLVVSRPGPTLVVGTRDGRVAIDPIAFFESVVQVATQSRWGMFASAPHLPRVTFDGVVVHRERWSFVPETLPFARIERGVNQLVEVRRWARSHDLPRFVFVKTPEETKPVYADLESPPYVELLCKLARGASAITISEMLPSVDELWLDDRAGARYTAELRVAAVDPTSWHPPSASGGSGTSGSAR